MSENSKIEWTTHTYNPWIGCTKVSPGCANCYAESEDKRRGWTTEGWGKGKPRKRTKTAPDVVKWNREAEGATERPRVFCSSLADWLDDEVPIEWLADLMKLVYVTPNLDWLLLSKRPGNWRPRLQKVADGIDSEASFITQKWLDGNAPDNVWLGTSVEDQKRADERIPVLLSIPAKVRFLSAEPLLGPVDLFSASGLMSRESGGAQLEDFLHWVIVGGESGPKARPFDIQWARSLRDQCQGAGVAYFLKQLGAKPYVDHPDIHVPITDKKGGLIDEFPRDLRIRQFPTQVSA